MVIDQPTSIGALPVAAPVASEWFDYGAWRCAARMVLGAGDGNFSTTSGSTAHTLARPRSPPLGTSIPGEHPARDATS